MIVFLMGKQRSGKDTVADYLVERYGFTKIGLADEVKNVATRYFGMKEKDRGLLIKIGMKMREIDPDVWLRWAGGKAVAYDRDGENVVIPDVRFPNEFEFFSEIGGIAVKVWAPQYLRTSRPGYDEEFEYDPTEEALSEYDTSLLLENTGSRTYLYQQIDGMMQDLGIEPLSEVQKE